MNDTISIFNSQGGLVPLASIDPTLIAALSPERRQRFDALRAAAETSAAAEAELRAADSAVSDATKAEAQARQALARARPVKTFHQLWQSEVQAKHDALTRD
jgi:hypothetical protein